MSSYVSLVVLNHVHKRVGRDQNRVAFKFGYSLTFSVGFVQTYQEKMLKVGKKLFFKTTCCL